MNKATIRHSQLDGFSRHVQPRKIKMSGKSQDGARKLPKIEAIHHTILSMSIRQAHKKASQLAEEKALLEELNGNDSLGG